jgi:hypothetical protein
MSSRICGHIPHPCDKLSMSQICGDDWCNKSHSHRKQIIPHTGYADVCHAPPCFAMVRLRRPGQNTNPSKTWQVGQLWLKSLLQKAFSFTPLQLSAMPDCPRKRLNAWVAETSDYLTCCYLRYEHNVYAVCGLRQWRADFQSIHSRNRIEVTVILDSSEAYRIASVYPTIHFTIPYNVAIAATILHNVVYLTVAQPESDRNLPLTLHLSLSSSYCRPLFSWSELKALPYIFPRDIVDIF